MCTFGIYICTHDVHFGCVKVEEGYACVSTKTDLDYVDLIDAGSTNKCDEDLSARLNYVISHKSDLKEDVSTFRGPKKIDEAASLYYTGCSMDDRNLPNHIDLWRSRCQTQRLRNLCRQRHSIRREECYRK